MAFEPKEALDSFNIYQLFGTMFRALMETLMSFPIRPFLSQLVIGFLILTGFVISSSNSQAQPPLPTRARSSLPTDLELSRFNLERIWWGQATLNAQRDTVAYVTVDEEAVFIQSTAGMVTAFDIESGAKMWTTPVGRADQISYKAVTNFDSVIIVTGLKMVALDRRNGKVSWEIDLPESPSTPPEIDDDHVFVGTLQGAAYAYDLKKIEELFREGKLPDWIYQAKSWRYPIGREVISEPVSIGDTIFFADRNKSIHALNADNSKLVYQFESDARLSAPMATDGERLYFASRDYNFYCMNIQTARTYWTFATGLPVQKKPRVVGEQVFVVAERGGMFAIGIRSGKEEWEYPVKEANDFIAASYDKVYAKDNASNFMIIDRNTGAVNGILPYSNFSTQVANDRTDRIVLVTPTGLVATLREKSRKFPTYYKYPDRRPILPLFAEDKPEDSATTDTDDPNKAEEMKKKPVKKKNEFDF